MHYFGYGSNLHLADVRRWCAEHGYSEARIRRLEPAWLPDHEPVFHYFSRARQGGALSVRPRLGAATPGAVFELDELGWQALDEKEGAKYSRRECVALVAGNEVRACTYVVRDNAREDRHVVPRSEYVELVREGLAALGLPTAQLMQAARGGSIDALPRAIFVYGTLMRGECREPLLARHQPLRWESAEVRGRLLDLGPYPGMVAGSGLVRGELVELHEPSNALRELDEVEDFEGYGEAGSLYRRVVVDVAGRPAWTYRYLGAGGVAVRSGDWRCR